MNRRFRLVSSVLLTLSFSGCATGSGVLVGDARPSTDPQLVKLYLKEPQAYDVIGLVEASSDSGWTDQKSQDYAVAELKKQAAKIGANGVLLAVSGTQSSAGVGAYGNGLIWVDSVNAKVVKGTAIFVEEE